MRNLTKTLIAAAVLSATGAAHASIATNSANAEAFVQVYDKSQGLTFDLDLGVTLTTLLAAVTNQLTLHYDLGTDTKWSTFATNLDPASTKFGVVDGFATKAVFTSNDTPVVPFSGFTNITTAIKNQAGAINIGATANTSLNVSKLVADSDNVGTGQWAYGSAGANPLTTLYGTFGNANAAINYGTTGSFYSEVAAAGAVTNTLLGAWTLSGNSLDFAYASASPVPLPAAVWMFGAGLMSWLRLQRKNHAA